MRLPNDRPSEKNIWVPASSQVIGSSRRENWIGDFVVALDFTFGLHLWCEQVDDSIAHSFECDSSEEEYDENNIGKDCCNLMWKYEYAEKITIYSYINHFRALSDPLDHGQVHQQPAGHQADPYHPVYLLRTLNIRRNIQRFSVPEICWNKTIS